MAPTFPTADAGLNVKLKKRMVFFQLFNPTKFGTKVEPRIRDTSPPTLSTIIPIIT